MKNMSAEELAAKYIEKTKRVFNELKKVGETSAHDDKRIKEVLAEANRYLKDAEYYLEKKKFETSLTSVAYCEGILDALRMLGFVDFEW